jgi:hypothetical protein
VHLIWANAKLPRYAAGSNAGNWSHGLLAEPTEEIIDADDGPDD